jgi:ubiquinone/menaquinone biosynthesis C-methylase UbiE
MRDDWHAEQRRTKRFFDVVRVVYPVFELSVLSAYRAALRTIPLGQGLRVLDIGAGTGALARALDERGHRVHGIDNSERMLKRARARVRGATFEACDITGLERFESGAYELACFGFVLHGLSPGLRRHALLQARRIARGRLLVFDYGPRRSLLVDIVERVEGPHYFEYVRRPFEQQLADAGLNAVASDASSSWGRWWLTEGEPAEAASSQFL